MEVILAGFNVDRETIEVLAGRPPAASAPLTPETLSAAYARISRDPRPVNVLRATAREDVARARRSNQRIIFEFGHHSVAEHAVFNFDLIGLSRLVVEALQSHRLASFTEKSQRYIRLHEDFIVPVEVQTLGLEGEFRAYVKRCFERYARAAAALEAAGLDAKPAGEDARYLLPLATAAQMGMTVNARTLEYMVRTLAAHPLEEARELARRLYEAAAQVAPSLLLFVDPGPYHRERPDAILRAVQAFGPDRGKPAPSDPAVRLLHATPDGDERVLAAVWTGISGIPSDEALARVKTLNPRQRIVLFQAATHAITVHDAPPREFEHATLTFELVISAAAFGQLKRHRLASLTAGPYDLALGCTWPPSFAQAGLEQTAHEAEQDARHVLESLIGPVAEYARLNAHRRRVVLTLNLREMYHVSRLREDSHAQWDIRALVRAMSEAAKQAFPVCAALLGGKDAIAARLAR